MERAYTVKELDALRHYCKQKWLFGYYGNPPAANTVTWGRQYKQHELDNAVEQLVRTHMMAGHTAEDLIASEQSEEKI